MSKHIVIVGGGIVGLSTALALVREGQAVTLIDADARGQAASWGNAGHIATEQVEPLASAAAIRSAPARLFSRGGALALPPRALGRWLPFAARMLQAAAPGRFADGKEALRTLMADALPAWRRLVETIGAPELLREAGHFVAWRTQAAADRGRADWATTDIGAATVRSAQPDELAMLAGLGGAIDAIRFGGTAQIADLRRLRETLLADVVARGVAIVAGQASLTITGGLVGVSIDGVPCCTPDLVLVAAGVRSGAMLAPLGHRVPIIAERGYHLRSGDHDWPAEAPPVVFEECSMIVTRYDDCVQVASFVELADADAPPDPAKWARLEAHVATLGLPIRAPFTRWMGARPTFPDYLPAIGRSGRARNLAYAFGHQHLGLTLAPVTAEIVAALVAGRPTIALGAFDLARFDNKGRQA